MAKKISIEIDGKDFPCVVSMGAFEDYYEATGKEASEGMTVRESGIWLWACVKSACERAKMEFPYERKEFMNSVTPDVLTAWAIASKEEIADKSDIGSKKK